jgi:hypothetical protein
MQAECPQGVPFRTQHPLGVVVNRPSVSGKLVINPFQFTETYDRVPGTDDFTVTLVGHRFQATTPGSGVVLQDVGRLVWSPGEEQLLFSAGQHDLLDDSQAAPYCAALS